VEQPQNSSTKAFFFITPPLLNMATRKDAILWLFFSLLLLPVAHGVFAKRGVATNEWSGGCADILALSNIFWYYDWSPTPLLNASECGSNIEFVPMVWGAADVNRTSAIPSSTTYLLAFNEPNLESQSNLLPAHAAELWQQVLINLKNDGFNVNNMKFGSPAVATGSTPIPPETWLAWFFGNCTGCNFDFVCIHVYDCNAPYFNSASVGYWISQFVDFSLPIWLTEFDCPSNTNAVTLSDELQFMQAVLPFLDNLTIIERYAWFTARASNNADSTGLYTSLLDKPGQLTTTGYLYNGETPSSAPSLSSVLSLLLHHVGQCWDTLSLVNAH